MPLITCPDCHREISDYAPACPGCGRPAPKRRSLAFSALKNLLIAAACFGALYWIVFAGSRNTASVAPQSAIESGPGWPRGPTDAQFSKDANDQGLTLCSIFVTPVGRNSPMLLIQKHGDQNLLHLKLYRQSWNYPQNTWGDLSVEFPDGNPLSLNGFRSGSVIDATIPAPATVAFASRLRESAWIMIALAGDQEPTWKVDLSGVPANMAKLNKCAMEQRAEAAGQR